jgi:hypothetical protein
MEFPKIWSSTLKNKLDENAILYNQSDDNLIQYIKKGYNPDNLIKPLLKDNSILKDYGKCNELSGSLWAFLGSALYKSKTTTDNN